MWDGEAVGVFWDVKLLGSHGQAGRLDASLLPHTTPQAAEQEIGRLLYEDTDGHREIPQFQLEVVHKWIVGALSHSCPQRQECCGVFYNIILFVTIHYLC